MSPHKSLLCSISLNYPPQQHPRLESSLSLPQVLLLLRLSASFLMARLIPFELLNGCTIFIRSLRMLELEETEEIICLFILQVDREESKFWVKGDAVG